MKSLKRKLTTILDNNYYKSQIGYPYRAYEALHYILQNFEFKSVLDIGCGQGIHSEEFLRNGKDVTAVDYGESYYFKKMKDNTNFNCVIADFNEYDFKTTYDCVWCSHILEHQLNPQMFLEKVVSLIKPGGVLAVTVLKQRKHTYG